LGATPGAGAGAAEEHLEAETLVVVAASGPAAAAVAAPGGTMVASALSDVTIGQAPGGIHGRVVINWIAPDPTSTVVSCSPDPVAVDVPTTCTATVTDTADVPRGPPTGDVTFVLDGFIFDQCEPSGSGASASCSVTHTFSATGSHTFTAGYDGDAIHSGSNSPGEVVAVDPRSATTTVGCSPDRVAVGRPTTCTATVTDTSAGTVSAPTGTVGFDLFSGGSGSFSDDQWTLSPTSPGAAGCSVTYTPSAVGSGLHTILAQYGGDSTHQGGFLSFGSTFVTVIADVAPAAPTITGLANGDGQVGVGFVDANPGTSPITSHEVTATDVGDPTAPPVTAKGPGSPIAVKGLTNGHTYVFTVTATSADGTSPPSAQSGRLNVGVAPVIESGPADGVVGWRYSSGFVITGAPSPTVTQVSGELPRGLALRSDGALTGTPTRAGDYTFTTRADNHVGIDDATVTVRIFPAAPCAGRASGIVGTAATNRLAGTPRADVIVGGTGRDRIRAGAGDDWVCGGGGNDRIFGGTGNDRLFGGPGNDRINPGAGRDRVAAGAGNDRIFSRDSQRDVIDCGPGRDLAIVDAVDRTRRCQTTRRAQPPRPPQRPAPLNSPG
jgi:Ca2+-binding RTX toxin-like protein